MSDVMVSCVDLPVMEETLNGDALAQVQGGVWGTLIRKGVEELAKTYVLNRICEAVDYGVNRAWTYWEEIQVEADTEAMAQARHEMRQHYYNRAG